MKTQGRVLGIQHGAAGYQHRGRRCETCTDGARRQKYESLLAHPEIRAEQRRYKAALGRAATRLRHAYPHEFAVLLEEELGRAPLKSGRKARA